MTYNEFIQNIIDTRGQGTIPEDGVGQNHHIIPVCMGGKPKKKRHDTIHENLIGLTPEEHYEAHRLLFEENSNNYSLGLAGASFHLFNNTEISKDEYGELGRNFISLLSERMTGCGNPHGGVHTNYNSAGFTGHTHSDASKIKMSNSSLGRKIGTSNRKGSKLSQSQKDALKQGLSKISKEQWSEQNKNGGKKRKSNGTTNTCNGLKGYNNGVNNKMFKPGSQPEGGVEGMKKSEKMEASKEVIGLKSTAYHRRKYEEYIKSININYYVNEFIAQRIQNKIGLVRFCNNNLLNVTYFKRYLEESNIKWQDF